MESKKVKWNGEEVFVHYIALHGEYALISRTPEKKSLFKITVADLDDEGKKLCATLLGQVEKGMQ